MGGEHSGKGKASRVRQQRLENLATLAGVNQRHWKSEGETNYGQVERECTWRVRKGERDDRWE